MKTLAIATILLLTACGSSVDLGELKSGSLSLTSHADITKSTDLGEAGLVCLIDVDRRRRVDATTPCLELTRWNLAEVGRLGDVGVTGETQ